MNLIFQLRRNFTIANYRYMKRGEYTFEPILDLYARKFRKMALDNSLLQKHKILLPANRLRAPEDTLLRLKKEHETAGVIPAREGLPEVNFVLDQRQCFSLKKLRHMQVQSYYIRIPETEEMIRVTYKDMVFHDDHNWIPLIYFDRYIVGKPNHLSIPIKIRKGFANSYLNAGGNLYQRVSRLHVLSYNDDYPTVFDLDPYNVTPTRGYKIGDLVNILPDGIVVHPMHNNNLNQNIFIVRGNTTKKLVQAIKHETEMKRIENRKSYEEFEADAKAMQAAEMKKSEEGEVKAKGPKTLFDVIVDQKSHKKDEEDIAGEELEDFDVPKTPGVLRALEKMKKRKELKLKMGKKTPFKNLKKSLLEEYSIKEGFKLNEDKPDKKGGDKSGGDGSPPSPTPKK